MLCSFSVCRRRFHPLSLWRQEQHSGEREWTRVIRIRVLTSYQLLFRPTHYFVLSQLFPWWSVSSSSDHGKFSGCMLSLYYYYCRERRGQNSLFIYLHNSSLTASIPWYYADAVISFLFSALLQLTLLQSPKTAMLLCFNGPRRKLKCLLT